MQQRAVAQQPVLQEVDPSSPRIVAPAWREAQVANVHQFAAPRSPWASVAAASRE